MTTMQMRSPVRGWDMTAGPLAVISLGAAAIHFAVMPEHVAEWWAFGAFFAALGWFQALWSIGYLAQPSERLAWVAIVINLATVLVWAWSRTLGLPIGPDPGVPEAIGAADVVASALEMLLVIGLLATRRGQEPESPDRLPSRRPTTVAVAALVAVLTSVAIALGGG
jgi:hypothetical protein